MQSALHSIIGQKEVHPTNLDGRVAIVTGGALGIGYEISRALAHAGCRVIMVNRKEEQGGDAISKIKEETPDAKIEWKECDLGNLSQVRDVFSKLRDSLDRLDYLALSAGINTNKYGVDADGIDRHFGVNHLGHFYVVNQMWPLLRKTSKMPGASPPRVVFLASEMHRTAPSDVKFASIDEINDPNVGPTQLYGRTKLAMILLAKYGLADKVIKKNNDHIYALSVHPGAVSDHSSQESERSVANRINRSIPRCSNNGRMPTLELPASFLPGPCSHLAAIPSKAHTLLFGRLCLLRSKRRT